MCVGEGLNCSELYPDGYLWIYQISTCGNTVDIHLL